MLAAVVMLAAAPCAAPGFFEGFFEAGWGTFFVSPGFGGLAASIAALLAYRSARSQSKITREHNRDVRWWTTLTWLYDRATDERAAARLPIPLALSLIGSLQELGVGKEQSRTAQRLLDMFPDGQTHDERADLGEPLGGGEAS